jgi:hypothetical protein
VQLSGKTSCMPPFQVDKFYKDGYDCMLDGYKLSL